MSKEISDNEPKLDSLDFTAGTKAAKGRIIKDPIFTSYYERLENRRDQPDCILYQDMAELHPIILGHRLGPTAETVYYTGALIAQEDPSLQQNPIFWATVDYTALLFADYDIRHDERLTENDRKEYQTCSRESILRLDSLLRQSHIVEQPETVPNQP
jgi:hypothetical protein